MSMGHSALLLEALHRRQRCTNKRLECGTRDVKLEHTRTQLSEHMDHPVLNLLSEHMGHPVLNLCQF